MFGSEDVIGYRSRIQGIYIFRLEMFIECMEMSLCQFAEKIYLILPHQICMRTNYYFFNSLINSIQMTTSYFLRNFLRIIISEFCNFTSISDITLIEQLSIRKLMSASFWTFFLNCVLALNHSSLSDHVIVYLKVHDWVVECWMYFLELW